MVTPQGGEASREAPAAERRSGRSWEGFGISMMVGNINGDGALMENHVDLEDDSINLWTVLGVSPHVHDVETEQSLAPAAAHNHHMERPLELVEQPSRRELFPVEGDPRLDPYVGMVFESGEAAKTFYIAYAGRVGFSVRIARSRRSKCNESVIMLRFVCSREGFSREKRVVAGKKTRKRAASIREGCNAMLEVIRRGDEKWVVTKLVKDHNHKVGLPSKVHYIATEGDTEMDPYLGMEFVSLEVAKMFYYAYASRVGFEARVRQSRRSLHDESLKMLKLVCSKHRYHSGRDNIGDDGKRGQLEDPTREGCEALFEVIRKDGDVWMVSKLVLEHTHELAPSSPSKVRCVRSQGEILVIAKNFEDTRNLLLNGQDRFPREIQYNELGPEDAQNLLEYFKKTQAENPAFFYAVQVENDNCMTNIFWADAKARMAYNYFGDAVTLDTTFKRNKELMPVVTFTGVNHHAQPVVFGCALLVDESEESFVWLFENWLAAMSARHPASLITDLNRAVEAAAAKILPNTRHCFAKKHVLNTIQEEFPDLYAAYHTPFEEELMTCIDESETSEMFESCWDAMIDRYGLRESTHLQSVYNIRHRWAPVYLKETFFAEIFVSQRSDYLDNVIEKYFTTKTSLRVAVGQLGQAIASHYEKEAQADFVTMYDKLFLRTASPMEKQAAGVYTRTIFDRFRKEFVESLGYHVDKIEDGAISKYRVARNEDTEETYEVTFNASENKVHCGCCMFESSGILCRHALKVFLIVGIRSLPKDYILKRWTKHAKSAALLDDYGVELRGNLEEPSTARYNDLCREAMRCAREGAASEEFYEVAKDALQNAISEVVSAKQMMGQQTLQCFIRSQKKRNKKSGKAIPKKDACRKKVKKIALKMGSLEDETSFDV